MSTQAVAWALDHRQTGPLTAESRLVLVMLAEYAGPDGRNAWPKKATLAARLGISARSVQRSLAALRAAGLIGPGDQRLVAHLDARYRPTVYDLALNGVQVVARGETFDLANEPYREDPAETLETIDSTLSTIDPTRGDAPVTPHPSRGDAGDTSGETPASPNEPPLEPSLTHLVLKGDPIAREPRATDDPAQVDLPARVAAARRAIADGKQRARTA